jgi:hypothetical protein
MFYAELDIRNYTYRTISDTEEEALQVLKKFWLSKRKPWGLTLNWQQVANDGYIRIYELELDTITSE